MALRKRIDKILGRTLVVIMSIMVINVLWQVFTRYVTGNPSSFTDELARYLMIWIGILGAAFVAGKNMHVAIDILPSRASVKTQKKNKDHSNFDYYSFCVFRIHRRGFPIGLYLPYFGATIPGAANTFGSGVLDYPNKWSFDHLL